METVVWTVTLAELPVVMCPKVNVLNGRSHPSQRKNPPPPVMWSLNIFPIAGTGLPGAPGGDDDGPGGHLLLYGGEVRPERPHHRRPRGDGRLGLHRPGRLGPHPQQAQPRGHRDQRQPVQSRCTHAGKHFLSLVALICLNPPHWALLERGQRGRKVLYHRGPCCQVIIITIILLTNLNKIEDALSWLEEFCQSIL